MFEIINGGALAGLAVFGIGLAACLIAGACLAVGSRSDGSR